MYVAAFVVTTPARPQLPDTFFASTSPPAVDYTVRPPGDPIAHLNQRIDAGELTLTFEGRSGYLRAVLAALQVPVDSQLAVFSKTSLQTPIIYSEAFEQLPAAAKTAIYERLWDVRSGAGGSARYARLTGTDGTRSSRSCVTPNPICRRSSARAADLDGPEPGVALTGPRAGH